MPMEYKVLLLRGMIESDFTHFKKAIYSRERKTTPFYFFKGSYLRTDFLEKGGTNSAERRMTKHDRV